MKPVIGITSSFNWTDHSYTLPDSYIQAVERAGGNSILLPPTMQADIERHLELVDGLMLTGGVDVDPNIYNEGPIPKMGQIDPLRDAYELKITKLALKLKKPMLAICRGCQVLNVAAEGTLWQDINSQVKESLKHSGQAPTFYPTHSVKIAPGSKLNAIYGTDLIYVNSFHHQGVKDIGKGLKATAWSEDGLIEGLEGSGAFTVGVQWHPERMLDSEQLKIFKTLIQSIV